MTLIARLRERLFGFQSSVKPEDIPRVVHHLDETKTKTEMNKGNVPAEFPKRVLFICSGNMCRSPYGEARFRQLAGELDVQVTSAGTLRIDGRKAACDMQTAAIANGLDLSSHLSKPLSLLLIQASDVIFVMESIHRNEVLRLCPQAEPKIVMLGQWLDPAQNELEDPMGKEPEVYQRVANEIDTALARWFEYHKPQSSTASISGTTLGNS